MNEILQPWQLLLAILSGWIHHRQQKMIEFQNDQIESLLKQMGRKRILLTDDQRRLLAVKGKDLGRKALRELTTIVTPDTMLRWHRKLVANKWDHSEKRKSVGRPRIRQVIVDLILRFAKQNSTWGYDRIQGALANVGYHISDSTVGNVLKAHGIEPAPDRQRQTTWATFLKAHWDVMAAIDFTTVEVWTRNGLATCYLLFVMELKTRRVHFAGCTTSPHESWMKQTARELTNCEDGFLQGKQHLIMDRKTKFCETFQSLLSKEGVQPVRLPPRAPNLNAHLERFFGSLKSECLHRLILLGEKATRNAILQYLDHYHMDRCHQGLDNELIVPLERPPDESAEIIAIERLGGLLRSYRRAA